MYENLCYIVTVNNKWVHVTNTVYQIGYDSKQQLMWVSKCYK